jgi:hypothetical protein
MCVRSVVWVVSAALGLLVAPAVTQGQVVNLVSNPSFEQDEVIGDSDWANWCTWGYDTGLSSTVTLDSTERIDGTRSLRVNPKGSVNWYFEVINLTLQMKVGTKYTVSFWAKAQAARPLTVHLKATDNSVAWGDTDYQLTTDWAEYKFTSVAQNTSVKLEILCAASEVPLWLDFVYIYEGDYVPGIKPSGLLNRGSAADPRPADQASDVPANTVLTWTPGAWAAAHDVYFGVSFADVNSASAAEPLDVLVSPGQDANSFDPGRLELGRTYYWRVDEVNAPPSAAIHKGSVWSFTVEPYSYPVTGIKATASSSINATMGPQKTVDGSGLDPATDQHGTESSSMWVTAKNKLPNWIRYELPSLCKLDKLWVWNSNYNVEPDVGFGAQDVTIEYSTDGVTWTTLAGVPEFAQATGEPNYVANTVVAFGGTVAKFVKLTIDETWGGGTTTGLSEVRFYAIPVVAREPAPAADATGIDPQATLSWRAGREAAAHEIYLSTDPQAVLSGTAPKFVTAAPSYTPALELGRTYYWKVVEVNQAKDPAAWEGPVWSFSTTASLPVEDFERYTDQEDHAVFETWIDGSMGNNTGSTAGLLNAVNGTFCATDIFHGGKQSMPLTYENTATTPTSEATRTFDQTQDWTRAGVATLTLYFYGTADNPTNVPLWVKLTDQNKKSAQVTFGAAGEDVTALADPAWTEWNIPLSGFGGVSLSRIQSITIGLGPGTGSGTLYFDDLQLYPARTIPAPVPATLVGYWKLDNNAQDSSGNGNHGTLNGGPTWSAAGKIGGALSLDGVDDYVDCGNGASLNITDTITLSAWINTADTGNSEHNPYVVKGDQSYALKHNTANAMEFFIYDGTWYAINGPLVDSNFNNTWHHVAGTYDGVQLKLYVDGVLVASRLHPGVIASTTYNVNIGRDAQNTGRLYKGLIDEVRIYHGTLPKAEIQKLAHP